MEGRKEGGQTNSLSFPLSVLGVGGGPRRWLKTTRTTLVYPEKRDSCLFFLFFLACVRVCPPRQCSTEEEESPTDTKSISRRESGREKAPRGFHPNTGCMNKILCGEVKHCYAFLKHPVCQMIKSPPRWLLLSDGAFRYTAKTRMTRRKSEKKHDFPYMRGKIFLFQLYSKSIAMFSGRYLISHRNES